jgi:hypothetical protein
MRTTGIIGLTLALGLLTGAAPAAHGADTQDPWQTAINQTPPRLSFTEGQVSFWRPGAQDWSQAQVNTPLAPGDELYTASPGTLELQIGAHAFVRARANTQVGLANQEPDFLQFKVATGSVSFDLRRLEPGRTVEVDTPNAAFTIEQGGYYRVEVAGERTSFITRRTGRATVTPASGQAVLITPSEEVVIQGTSSPQIAAYAAPPFDAWDNWNYARSNGFLDAVSARHVSPGTYGASDLDRYGTWRSVPTYGSVWVPTAVQAGWVPYSTGSWMNDPFYGWTWVDTAPWGWAPYHYGRWVSVDGFWAWAPGPIVTRPVYAPALVGFFGGPSLSIGISIGGPVLGWVALGWGEPIVPWWGREGFRHVPSWGGWGGPRVVNNTVINNTTVVNVQNINVYRNSSVPNAVVVVPENRFGRGPITSARVARVNVTSLQPTHTAPQIAATPASFVPTTSRGIRPPEESLKRPVVATRPPRSGSASAAWGERKVGPAGIPTPAPRLVSPPAAQQTPLIPPRPPFGRSTVERPIDRGQPPPPPGAPATRQASPRPQRERQVGAPSPTAPPSSARRVEPPQVVTPSPTTPQPPAGRRTAPPSSARRVEPPQVVTPSPTTPQPPAGRPTAPPPSARRVEPPQVVTPSPTTPQPPAGRPTAPPPLARRPKIAAPPARALPGEPANLLAPHRAETPQPQRVDRKTPPPHPQSAPESAPRERAGGR